MKTKPQEGDQQRRPPSAEDVTMAMGGKWSRRGYGMICCPVHKERRPSCKVVDGERQLLVYCMSAGCAAGDIMKALSSLGALRGERIEQTADDIRRRNEKREAQENRDRERALLIWRESCCADGTLVDLYLRSRRISIPIPCTLKFHPRLWSTEAKKPFSGQVAIVQRPDGKKGGIHRTFLVPPGAKAPLVDPRLTYGRVPGGAIRLAKAGDTLAIGEGVETCLSYMEMFTVPSWAAGSAANLRNIILPPLPIASVVHVLVDNDEKGQGENAALFLKRRLEEEGREVLLKRSAIGKDWNDELQGVRNAA